MLMWLATEKGLAKQGIHFIKDDLSGRNTEHYKTLDYYIEKYNLQNKKLFLKIYIEGSEYEVLKEDSFYNHLPNVSQLIFKFHYMKEKLPELTGIMKRLEQTHTLVHIHANDNGGVFDYKGKKVPEIIEVVFLHRSILPEKIVSENVPG